MPFMCYDKAWFKYMRDVYIYGHRETINIGVHVYPAEESKIGWNICRGFYNQPLSNSTYQI